MKIRKEKDFISVFDECTGKYIRTGIIKNGKDTGEDPICTNLIKILAFVAALFFVFQQKNPQNRLKMHPQRED